MDGGDDERIGQRSCGSTWCIRVFPSFSFLIYLSLFLSLSLGFRISVVGGRLATEVVIEQRGFLTSFSSLHDIVDRLSGSRVGWWGGVYDLYGIREVF